MRPTALSTARNPGTVALSPDHAFMVGRGNLASTLNQDAVSIEQ